VPERSLRSTFASIAIWAVFAVYPVLVWLGLAHESPRAVAIGLLCVLVPVLAYAIRRNGLGATSTMVLIPLLTVGAILMSAVFDDASWLYAEPVVISVCLLLLFGATLRRGAMPMIERFARLQESHLSPPQQAWCRLWTWIWCTFFVVNGTTSAVLAMAAPLQWWVVYTTGIVYAVMGCLFATEWWLRRRRFGRG
jgi:uncharacterized membrane protein